MRLGDRNFFNLFQRLVAASNPNHDCDQWEIKDTSWRRHRHLHWAALSFQLVAYEIEHGGHAGWRLLFVRETWWPTNRQRAIRDTSWAHVEYGSRRDVITWFKSREQGLDRTVAIARK